MTSAGEVDRGAWERSREGKTSCVAASTALAIPIDSIVGKMEAVGMCVAGSPQLRSCQMRLRSSMMRRSNWQIGFTWILVVFSAYVAVVTYPSGPSQLAVSMGVAAFLALVLRVGWVIPCTIAGVYVGLIMDARVKGGSDESQMLKTVASICGGAIAGFVVGFMIDGCKDSCANEGNPTIRQE